MPTVGALLALALFTTAARADFIGQSVHVVDAFPDMTTVAVDLGTQTIAAGGTTFTGGINEENVVVFGTSFTINFPIGTTFVSAPFNGFVVSEVGPSPDTITGASLASTNIPSFDSSRITFDATDVFVNFQGLVVPNPGDLSVNVTFGATATPEPASLTLLGLGVAGLAGYRCRRRASA
jgi:hypothetical protein